MKATREEKIARMLQKELGNLFLKQAAQHKGVIVSVSDVRVTPDLSLAKVYLSIFPSEKAKDIFDIINLDSKTIRFDLGRAIKDVVRIIPKLEFAIDDSINYLEKIDNLLKK